MSGNVVFSGDLRFISLADCFQILGSNNSTGILQLTSPYNSSSGTVFFVDGNPINGKNDSRTGVEAIYSLFGWLDGSFAFFEEPVNAERVVHYGRMEIVLDALRMLDDGLVAKLGPGTCQVISGSGYAVSDSSERDTLPLIKGPFVDYMHVIDEEDFRDGTIVVSEGGHGTWIWVILEGVVRVTRETESGTLHIGRLGEGCFIGTLTSFLQRDYIRNASVTAEGNVQLGVLDTLRLHREFASLSSDFRDLLPGLDARLNKVTNRAVEVFEGKNGAEDGLLEGEELVIKEGGLDKDVYLISSGNARVVKNAPQGYVPLLTLEPGEFFGGVPFLDMGHEPHNASIVGTEELNIKKISAGELQQDYVKLSGTFKNLISNTCMCVSMTTRLISP